MCFSAECATIQSQLGVSTGPVASNLTTKTHNPSYDITFDSHSGPSNVTQSLVNNSLVTNAEVPANPLEWGMMGLTLIIACTTVGNLLVCLAVCWERRLQNMTNYFLMSLAIADLLVSLLVMPLGMIVEIFGYFPMNPEVCVLWVASDVLMCSASIWHMCTMSMDRYFTLKYPMRYGRNKTRRMVAGKILFVWVVSVAISSPVCIHGFLDTSSVYRNGLCVPKVKNFVIYGSVFAFYIPLLIMIVTYVLTLRILRKNQQRMKHVERSRLKPRLAQVTAQCTGLAFPKLLSGLRKSSRSASSSRAVLSGAKARRRSMGLACVSVASSPFSGNDNLASDAHFGEDSIRSGKDQLGMVYLAPPTPQTLTPGSCSPVSARNPLNSDTDESESEATYFSLVQTSPSCRSLNTPSPNSMSTSDKSLQVKLPKKQLQQQQQHQELHSLRQKYHSQRRLHKTQSPKTLLSSPSLTSKELFFGEQDFSFSASAPATPSSSVSTLFDNEAQQADSVLNKNNGNNNIRSVLKQKSVSPTRSLSRKSSNAEIGNRSSKKKRYSKRCKKRRNSLTQESGQTDHLTVPCPVYLRKTRAKKQGGTAALTNAVSDTQVSQVGRESKSSGQCDQGVTSFHLSYNNLSKDYKSMEWDRRYFQIQEEMDRCLKGEFGLWERRHSKQDQISENLLSTDKITDTDPKEKTVLAKPEILIPAPDALSVHFNNVCNVYSHSAPNSPLNRRTCYSLATSVNSDEEEEYELENEELSDKTNDEEDNDTSGSSNSDTVTIRLHPPTPKVKNSSRDKLNADSNSCEKLPTHNNQHVISLSVPCQNSTKTEHMNGLIHFRSSSSSSICSNKQTSNSLANGISVQSVSQASTSPIPEFVISSEGELTLEDTDDTIDDVPRDQRVKLRRPNQLQPHYRFIRSPSPSNHDNYYKSKKSTRNTFRIHRGKDSVKHILSSKTASNERKASKVLGIIFIVFVILWTPFFAVNIMNAACDTCMDNFNKELMSLFLWMGYIASLANPIIYTMFNTAFRRAFIKILTCKIRRSFRSASCEAHYMSYTTMLASERRNTVTVVLRDESR